LFFCILADFKTAWVSWEDFPGGDRIASGLHRLNSLYLSARFVKRQAGSHHGQCRSVGFSHAITPIIVISGVATIIQQSFDIQGKTHGQHCPWLPPHQYWSPGRIVANPYMCPARHRWGSGRACIRNAKTSGVPQGEQERHKANPDFSPRQAGDGRSEFGNGDVQPGVPG
jgi:hypothetical protein